MPGWGLTSETGPWPPGTNRRFKEGSISYTVIDMHKNFRSFNVKVHDVVFTDNQARDLGNSVAKLSNAGLVETRVTRRDYIMPDDVIAYDEGYSSADDYCNFLFQKDSNPNETVVVQVPAFDQSYILGGGIDLTDDIDPTNHKPYEMINDVLGILGSGWAFVRAWMTVGGKKTVQTYAADVPQVDEPGATDSPGDGPGT